MFRQELAAQGKHIPLAPPTKPFPSMEIQISNVPPVLACCLPKPICSGERSLVDLTPGVEQSVRPHSLTLSPSPLPL